MIHFQDLKERSAHNEAEILSLVNELPQEVLAYKLSKEKWSFLEVIKHLNLTYDLYFPRIIQTLKQCDERQPQSSFKERWHIRLFTDMLKPKNDKRSWKMKTFKFFEPDQVQQNDDTTLKIFLKNKSEFNEFIRQAQTKNLKQAKVISAVGSSLKFYLPECFDFLLAHEERHIVQAREALRSAQIAA